MAPIYGPRPKTAGTAYSVGSRAAIETEHGWLC